MQFGIRDVHLAQIFGNSDEFSQFRLIRTPKQAESNSHDAIVMSLLIFYAEVPPFRAPTSLAPPQNSQETSQAGIGNPSCPLEVQSHNISW